MAYYAGTNSLRIHPIVGLLYYSFLCTHTVRAWNKCVLVDLLRKPVLAVYIVAHCSTSLTPAPAPSRSEYLMRGLSHTSIHCAKAWNMQALTTIAAIWWVHELRFLKAIVRIPALLCVYEEPNATQNKKTVTKTKALSCTVHGYTRQNFTVFTWSSLWMPHLWLSYTTPHSTKIKYETNELKRP